MIHKNGWKNNAVWGIMNFNMKQPEQVEQKKSGSTNISGSDGPRPPSTAQSGHFEDFIGNFEMCGRLAKMLGVS